MCRKFTVLFTLLFGLIFGDPSIVFIHIGPSIPAYAEIALLQAREFNPDCSIFFVGNRAALKNFHVRDPKANITFIACESLEKTPQHQRFLNRTRLQSGFWRVTSERFLYLHDLIECFQLPDVFHLEYDNLLYVDVKRLIPTLKKHYKGIAAPFNNDDFCIPGFVYIPNPWEMEQLAKCFAENAGGQGPQRREMNDMEILATLRKEKGTDRLDMLPTTFYEYSVDYPLISKRNHVAAEPETYFRYAEAFRGIFDAAALGQFLGGEDPIHNSPYKSYNNPNCVFDASLFNYSWEVDGLGRKLPYLHYGNKKMPIFNLHIHCKRLSEFASKPY